ncbi:hypothetical protein BaOVIS_022850 [Babesia ovis]|uniref:Uncharacterized protein n=1 Tax=Babesia ovis TaxID=5869 RepID=A0A9W5WVE9_BABOV|nr:hypothetical protein BaOVIS_022850 [Babesia ovis]
MAAGFHLYAGNRANGILDILFGIFAVVQVVYPTWLGLVGIMTFSLTLLCSALLLFFMGFAYQKAAWSNDILENSSIVAYGLDVIYYLSVFTVLNFIWEKPSVDSLYSDQDNTNFTEQDDVWAPFSGTGKAVTEYEVNFPKLEASVSPKRGYAV